MREIFLHDVRRAFQQFRIECASFGCGIDLGVDVGLRCFHSGKALVHLGQSIVMVSFPVEVWKQPRVLDSGASYIQLIKEPVV